MSQLILDLSDPAVAEMVSQWTDGGQYRIELLITQKPAAGGLGPYDVNEITDYGDAESVEEEGAEEQGIGSLAGDEPAGKAPRSPAGIPAP